MDIDKVIDDVERYLAQFILYLVSFFRGQKALEQDSPPALENNVVIFSILSAVLGSYITRRYGSGISLAGQGLLDATIGELLWWITLGVCLYVVMAAVKPRPPMMDCITVGLKVFPVAYVICAFIAYLVDNLFNNLGPFSHLAGIAANWSASLFELIFATFYLPRRFPPLADGDEAERKAVLADRQLGVASVLFLLYGRVLVQNLGYVLHHQAYFAAEGRWLVSECQWLISECRWLISECRRLIAPLVKFFSRR